VALIHTIIANVTDEMFDICVEFLRWMASGLGLSYEAVNVWIFCVLWPVVTMALVVLILIQRIKIRALQHELVGNKLGQMS
jgi:hypothetical protein